MQEMVRIKRGEVWSLRKKVRNWHIKPKAFFLFLSVALHRRKCRFPQQEHEVICLKGVLTISPRSRCAGERPLYCRLTQRHLDDRRGLYETHDLFYKKTASFKAASLMVSIIVLTICLPQFSLCNVHHFVVPPTYKRLMAICFPGKHFYSSFRSRFPGFPARSLHQSCWTIEASLQGYLLSIAFVSWSYLCLDSASRLRWMYSQL